MSKKSPDNKKEKKEKKGWYARCNKYVKGLLCMITFSIFAGSFVFFVVAAQQYGLHSLRNPGMNYFDTATYQADLYNQTETILYWVQEMEEFSSDFSVTYIEDGVIKEYNGEAAYNHSVMSWEEFLQDEASYLVKSQKYDSDWFYDMEQMKNYLNSDRAKEDNYLYYTENAFQNLFQIGGLKNTDNRYSDEFPENALFLFECDEVTRLYLEQTKNARNAVEGMTYAVYLPDEKLYYSTEDDYFEPMTLYIYDACEVRDSLKNNEENEQYSNSIIFALLRSGNLYNGEFWNYVRGKYEWMAECRADVNMYKDSHYLYYYESGSYSAGNVEDVSAFSNLEYAYEAKNGELNCIGTNIYAWEMEEYMDGMILEMLSNSPKGTVFYFGIDKNGIADAKNDASSLVTNIIMYQSLVDGGRIGAVVALVSFILLMMQAVSMIRTTGRTDFAGTGEQSDGESGTPVVPLRLNRYDKLTTEIWLIANIIIYEISMFLVMVIAMGIENYFISGQMVMVGHISAVAAIPFGLAFMMITLSFARRLKAHNVLSYSVIYRLFRRLIGKPIHVPEKELHSTGKLAKKMEAGVKRIGRIRGTHKFLIVLVIYLLLTLFLAFLSVDCSAEEPLAVLAFVQVIALGTGIWIVKDINRLIDGINEITKGDLNHKVAINENVSMFNELAAGINHIGDGLQQAVETSIKDERMKTELITNVSHDLKTPLTSIINYIDLLKKEEMPNDEARHYIEVLDAKSQRLKQLTEDLVEAAKATSGNIELEMMPITFDELMKQALGEFEEKFDKRNLTMVATYPVEPAVIIADGRRLYRIIENVLQNVYKYALEGTRVYVDLSKNDGMVIFTLKNISASPLNISPDELMERFTRGDSSRTTEGSGLGLSIAKDLTRLQDGTFEIQMDGDLFKVIIKFPQHNQEKGTLI